MQSALTAIVRDVIRDSHTPAFRVVEFCALLNHLHLLVEASDQASLAAAMQALGVRLARRINRHLQRRGPLLAERYHHRLLRTPRQVRNALRYVLLNARHHAADAGRRLARGRAYPAPRQTPAHGY